MKRNMYVIYAENIANDLTCKFYDTSQSYT